MKTLHRWIGFGSAAVLLLACLTGWALSHPARLFPELRREPLIVLTHPRDAKVLWRVAREALLRSEDRGEHWAEMNVDMPVGPVFMGSDASGRTLVLAGRWGEMIRSTDGGTVWGRIEPPMDFQAEGVKVRSLSVAADGGLFLQTSRGLWHTADGGRRWNPTGEPPERSLYSVILDLHTGYFFGTWFVWALDFGVISLIILIGSGIFIWRKKEDKLWK